MVSPGPGGCARRGWGATSRCRTPAWPERSLPPPALGERSHRNLTTRQLWLMEGRWSSETSRVRIAARSKPFVPDTIGKFPAEPAAKAETGRSRRC